MGKKNILVLGMVYVKGRVVEPSLGQRYRDTIRIIALEESYNCDVYSLDNKHGIDENDMGRHINADFTNPRRLNNEIKEKWGDITFDAIILDYFFSPVCL
jgi:hypothetical protein